MASSSIVRIARFLNILEPTRDILSITKVAMWLSLSWLTLSVFGFTELGVPEAMTMAGTFGLYSWRRFVFWKTGKVSADGKLA